jgi:tetratricopeptide (TPR) repeat protein
MHLTVIFNRAVFYMQENNHAKARKMFTKCIEVYSMFFGRVDRDLYNVMFEIGMLLYDKENYGECVFYFQKVSQNNDTEKAAVALRQRAARKLVRTFFRMEDWEGCKKQAG